jgi:hypothetical protein
MRVCLFVACLTDSRKPTEDVPAATAAAATFGLAEIVTARDPRGVAASRHLRALAGPTIRRSVLAPSTAAVPLSTQRPSALR